MQQDIPSLLNLTIEIEGLLRVIQNRNDIDAKALLIQKINMLHNLAKTSSIEDYEEKVIENNDDPIIENIDNPAIEKDEDPILKSDEEKEDKKEVAAIDLGLSINDKYYYIRELFNGDASAYNEALQRLAQMHTLDEAFDYFLNELEWDADQEAAGEFLTVVANYFNH